MTTVEALKKLYAALGGEAADVQNLDTNVAVLNAISAKYEGAADAVLNADAVANIAEAVGEGGGGSSDITTCNVNLSAYTTMKVYLPHADKVGSTEFASGYVDLTSGYTTGVTCWLYKGQARFEVPSDIAKNVTIAVSGSATLFGTMVDITGDCSITINQKN